MPRLRERRRSVQPSRWIFEAGTELQQREKRGIQTALKIRHQGVDHMTISGIVKSSLVDFPGHISSVLFLPGCNYDCFYCHNRQIINGSHSKLDIEEILEFLKKRVGLIDGVVITGGEPTLHHDLQQFIETIKELGYKIKLDTNGSSPDVISQFLDLGLCDYYAVDYKAPFARYREVAGMCADAKKVLQTINLLLGSGTEFEVRTTLIPQLKEEDLVAMARELPVLPKYVLNAYRKPEFYHLEDEERILQTPYTKNQIKSLAKVIVEYQPNVTA